MAGAGTRRPSPPSRRRPLRAVERHELDEAHVHRAVAGELDEGVELVLDAVEQQRVELDGREAGGEGRVEAGERVGEAAAARERANRSGSRLSMLTLTRRRPARRSSSAKRGSSRPLVVSEMSSMPLVRLSMPTKSAQPLRTSGSPPVMRTLLMPQPAATRAKAASSS